MSHTEAQRTQRKDKKSMIKIGKITNYAEKNVNRQMKDAPKMNVQHRTSNPAGGGK